MNPIQIDPKRPDVEDSDQLGKTREDRGKHDLG